MLQKLTDSDLTLDIGVHGHPSTKTSSWSRRSAVHLTMNIHISKVVLSSCYYQLRRVFATAGSPCRTSLNWSFDASYYDIISAWLLQLTVVSSAVVSHSASAARNECRSWCDHELVHGHVKPALKQLHWLPVEHKIAHNLCYLCTSSALVKLCIPNIWQTA